MAFVLWGQLRLIILFFVLFFNDQEIYVFFTSNHLRNSSTNHLLVGGKQRPVKESMQALFCRHTSLAKGDTKIFLTETLISYTFTIGKQINEENLAI